MGATLTQRRLDLAFINANLLLWIGFALLTGCVIWGLLIPFKAKRAREATVAESGKDVALYRDQLAEVERDVERGVMGEAEAEAARIEVSRRLLAAVDANKSDVAPSKTSPRSIALAMIVFIPAVSLGLYLMLGSPEVPDEPFAPRVAGPANELPLDALVYKVEQHLKEKPGDLQGWEVLGPAYVRQRNFPGAITAWTRAMELGGVTAARLAARGEAEFFMSNGSMTPEAQADFEKAVKLDPLEPRAQYYLGLADIRDGNKDKAIARWKKLLANAPKDAPWRASVEADLAKLLQPAPLGGPTMADAQAAGNMTPEARQQMISTMVARLAGRLEQNPNDLPGWLRLIRSYGVLGKLDEAKQALVTARKTFAGDKSALAQLDDAEKALPSK